MPLGFLGDILGLNQAKQARQSSAAQNNIAKQQLGMMQQASPYYGGILQFLAQNAGMQMPPGIAGPIQPGARTGPQPGFGSSMDQLAAMRDGGQANIQPMPRAGAMGGQPAAGLPAGALGIYGSNPADVFRMQQAQEQIDQLANQRAKTLQYQLGQQGLGNSATAGAALARNQQDALSQLANFRRGLAINAGPEQERRVQALLSAMGIGNAAGGQAAGIYGQTGAQALQQGQGQQQLLMQLLPLLF